MVLQMDHWREWEARCALDLCPMQTQQELRAFVSRRFEYYGACIARRTSREPAPSVPPDEAWHAFETWLRLRHTREGKVYKRWLLDHGGGPSDLEASHIEGAASLLVREVVREHLRRESTPAFVVSLDATAATMPALSELLPGPSQAMDAADLDRLAAAEAPGILRQLTRRARVALLARELDLPLSHPRVLRTARCGKSVLSEAYLLALRGLAQRVQQGYPTEPRATQADLTIRVFGALRDPLLAWGRTHRDCATFFRLAGERRAAPLETAVHPAGGTP